MEHYKFGKPEGRHIGDYGRYSVYERTIVRMDSAGSAGKTIHNPAPGEFDFYYGPSTGGLMESVGFRLTTPGEMISSAEVNPDFKKRVLRLKGLTVDDALLRIERLNGFHSASHTVAFLAAVEDALQFEVPEQVKKARIVMLELERIRSNLEVVKRMCEPAGFGVPVNQIGYLREKASRIISEASGHRFFFGISGTGKASINVAGAGKALSVLGSEFNRIFQGLQESKIFLNRLQNNGITAGVELTGPAARAAGRRVDARLDSPDLPYSELSFEPVVRDEKDCFGRFMVRGQEILQSVELIHSVGDPGAVNKSPHTGKESGEGAGRVESPQGDLFYYVKLDDGKLADIWYVSPSSMNVRAFEQSMKGNIFTDFHFNWESFGIWISELGVELK